MIPDGWVPEGTCIDGVVIHDYARDRWEAVLPAFSIAGMGATPDEAADQAMSLLRDYLALCAVEGLTFEQSYRGMGWRWVVAAFGTVARAWLHERRRRRAVQRIHRMLLPAH